MQERRQHLNKQKNTRVSPPLSPVLKIRPVSVTAVTAGTCTASHGRIGVMCVLFSAQPNPDVFRSMDYGDACQEFNVMFPRVIEVVGRYVAGCYTAVVLTIMRVALKQASVRRYAQKARAEVRITNTFVARDCRELQARACTY